MIFEFAYCLIRVAVQKDGCSEFPLLYMLFSVKVSHYRAGVTISFRMKG